MLTSSFSNSEDLLRSSISSLDSDTINEVVLANANIIESKSVDMQMRRLESIQFQRELIEEEREETEEAKQERLLYLASQIDIKLLPDTPQIEEKVSVGEFSSQETETQLKYESGAAGTGDEKSFSLSENLKSTLKVESTELKEEPFEMERKGTELTFSEMEAISDLARGSSVAREKAEFAALKAILIEEENEKNAQDGSSGGAGRENYKPKVKVVADLSQSEDLSLLAKSDAPRTSMSDYKTEEKEEEDVSVTHMKSVLTSMLDKLQVKIDVTEKALGDTFNLLDLDRDGELTVSELKGAIKKILKRTISEEQAQDIVMLIDKDNDGKVSVRELLQYVESKKEKEEVEALEAQIHAIKKKTAIKEILKRDVTENEAQKIVDLVADNGGKVSVKDLRQFSNENSEKGKNR